MPALPYSRGRRPRPGRRRAGALPRAQRARRSRSRARASRPPAACPTSARRAGSGSASTRWSTATSTCSRAIRRASGSAGPSRSSARASPTTRRTPRSRGSRSGGFIAGVVTQNIDGLHHAAGSEAVEVHGHLRTARCLRCGAEEEMAPALARYAETRLAPECRACGGTLRPQVVLFGEPLPGGRLGRARPRSSQRAGGCLCVGTSLQVYPAAGLAEAFARARRPLAIVSRSRRRSGRTPIRACWARPRSSCPPSRPYLLPTEQIAP